jgi:hypothetical protein
MVPIGIQPIAAGNFKWLDAVAIRGRLGRELQKLENVLN